jgi:hypothetical protein
MIRRVATMIVAALAAAVVVASLAGCGLRGGRDEPVSPAGGASNSGSEASPAAEEVNLDLDADLAAIDAELSQIEGDVSAGSESEAREEK